MDRIVSRMSYPTAVLLGPGAIGHLGEWASKLGLKKPLIMTDRAIAQAGLVDRISQELKKEGIGHGLFDGARSNPTEQDVEVGVEAYLSNGSDAIIAFGGGGPLDMAKLVRLLSTHDRPLARYEASRGGAALITSSLPPLIAVPTTAGSGSEVTARAVAILRETGRKAVIRAAPLMPNVAICDPELTFVLPPGPTAWTGMDAFARCAEAFCAAGFHPLADALAIDGVARCARSLVRSLQEPESLEARTDLMVAAIEGAMAMEKGLGACEALANAAGAVADLRHGLAAGVCIAAVLEFNRPAIGRRLAKLAVAMGEDPTARDDILASTAVERVTRLAREANSPAGVKEAGLREEQLLQLAEKAVLDEAVATNPRKVLADDLFAIAKSAY